ncbi:MAG: ComEC/Rec2 family competence protein [Patescibacteria group bacterium]
MRENVKEFLKDSWILVMILVVSILYSLIVGKTEFQTNNIQYNTLFYETFCNWNVNILSNVECYDKANLASGIILGMANYTEEFKNSMTGLGLIHIVVASGSQVQLIKTLIDYCLIRLGVFPNFRLFIFVLFILGYILFLGLTPPVFRSFLFILLPTILAVFFGRFLRPIHNVFLSISLILFLFPNWIYSISFGLSLFSSLALMVNTILFSKSKYRIITEQFLVLILTIPIISLFSSRINLVSIPLNIVFSYILPFLLIFIFLTLITQSIGLNTISIFLNYIFEIILSLCKIVENSFQIFLTITLTKPSIQFLIGYYTIVFFVIFYLYSSNNVYTILAD